MVADGLAELQIRWPNVPMVFCETRQLAEEWTYRFLAAAHEWVLTESPALQRIPSSQIDVADHARRPPRPNQVPPWSVPGHVLVAWQYPIAAACDQKFGTPGVTPTTKDA